MGSFLDLFFLCAFAGGVHLHLDLKHLECRKDNGIFGTGTRLEDLYGLFQPKLAVWRNSHGKPDIVGMVTQVVVADARMGIDDLGRFFYLPFFDLKGNK